MPLLTLKVDLYHEGAEPDPDDHKTIHERLLEVAVPDPPEDGRSITLEDCLGEYFNGQVDVRRKIDEPLRRTNTMSSVISETTPFSEKEGGVEALSRSMPSSPISPLSQGSLSPGAPFPPVTRQRSPSFIREVLVEHIERATGMQASDRHRRNSMRKGRTLRKEVSIPAWQFFNLIRPSPIYLPSKSLFTPPHSPRLLIGNIAWVTGKNSLSPGPRIPDHLGTNPAIAITLKRYDL